MKRAWVVLTALAMALGTHAPFGAERVVGDHVDAAVRRAETHASGTPPAPRRTAPCSAASTRARSVTSTSDEPTAT